jgi:hypothetical protein
MARTADGPSFLATNCFNDSLTYDFVSENFANLSLCIV